MIWRLFPPTQRTSANTWARRHSLDNPPEWAIRPGTGLAQSDDAAGERTTMATERGLAISPHGDSQRTGGGPA